MMDAENELGFEPPSSPRELCGRKHAIFPFKPQYSHLQREENSKMMTPGLM